MKKEIHFSCPMDCFDVCGLIAAVENDRVVSIRGDKEHPLTRGACCKKGLKLLERLYHPQRLTSPLRRTAKGWAKITWTEAIDEIAEKFTQSIRRFNSSSILNYSSSGYGGLIKKIDEVFFNYLGGVTDSRGSLCWGAGIAAQRYDFGSVLGHHPDDIARAKTIVLWGRNPADTNLHLVPSLAKARKSGATVALIDPRRSTSAKMADIHLAIRPATDGALALGLANVIVENGWHDREFISQRVHGFDAYRKYIRDFPPERVERITGVAREHIVELARTYSGEKPAGIFIGYGLQRYSNGGNTVRCIDALGAITGNIGLSGAGVNYANQSFPKYTAGEIKKSKSYARNRRTFSVAKVAEFLETANDPPIKCMMISKANPLVQGPDITRALKAFEGVEFKVVIDMFMTDTARHADLVLPCTSVLEEEDIIYTGMFSPYINFSVRAVDPPKGVMSEYDFFAALARRMAITRYPFISPKDFLRGAIQPLKEKFGVGYDELKNKYCFSLPGREIPWQDGVFATPSGKYELYSERALKDGQSPLPVFIEGEKGDKQYPLRLLTPHTKNSLHSQHFAFVDDKPEAFLHSLTLQAYHLEDGGLARVCSPQGELLVRVQSDDRFADDMVVIYEGWWHKSGSVNFLTHSGISDMGEQAAYYDCFCRIEPVKK